MPKIPASLQDVQGLALPGLSINQAWAHRSIPARRNNPGGSGGSRSADQRSGLLSAGLAGSGRRTTDGAGSLLALFSVDGNNSLTDYGQSVVQTGYFLVSLYNPDG